MEHAEEPEFVEQRVTIPVAVGGAARGRPAGERDHQRGAVRAGGDPPARDVLRMGDRARSRPTLGQPGAVPRCDRRRPTHVNDVVVGPSRLEHAVDDHVHAAPGATACGGNVRLADLDAEELEFFDGRTGLRAHARAATSHGIPARFPVTPELLFLFGFFVAEGSCSARGGIRLAIGNGQPRARRRTERGASARSSGRRRRCTSRPRAVGGAASDQPRRRPRLAEPGRWRSHRDDQADPGARLQRAAPSCGWRSCAGCCSATAP